ncbi:MAG: trypsin-like peptidase domain-containing protein [Oscillospiraceae bacterium]|nr:trypsin-like peptidase domain-containing protein [Oscillospiraceae bacterium]
MKKRIILALILVLFIALAIIPNAFAAEQQDARMIAQVNKPGVIYVYSRWTATMLWNEWAVYDDLYDDVFYYVVEYLGIDYGSSSFWPTYISLFIDNMLDYAYYTGGSNTTSAWIGAHGTGFIITPDGYLVTNAHVVEMSEKEIAQTISTYRLRSQASTHVDNFARNWSNNYGYNMSSSERDALYYAVYDIYSITMEVTDTSHMHVAYMGNVTPGSDVSTKGVMLDVRKVGEPSSSKDVAILKLDGSNYPTVALGDDKELKTGDPIYVMGYPGIVDGAVEEVTAMQEPVMTQGILSAKQVWNDGGNILQYDAATFGGNSGGPVFNQYGEVIGIHTFGLNDKGQRVSGYAFSVPISTAKVYLNELNITPSESKFTADFKAALEAYNNGDYATALELVRGINETNPGFPVIQDLLADARTAYDADPNKGQSSVTTPGDTPGDSTTTADLTVPEKTSASSSEGGISLLTILLIVGGVVVIGVVVVVILIASKKKSTAAPAQTQYAPQPQFPQQVPQPQFPQQAPQPQFPQQAPQPQFPQQAAPAPAYQPQPEYQPTVVVPSAVAEAPVSSPTIAPTAVGTPCPRCGVMLAPDAKFCDACGFSIQTIEVIPSNQCPQCGAAIAPGAKFCNVCGFQM